MSDYILGLSCFYHDSAVALVKNGEIVVEVQEERFLSLLNDLRCPKCQGSNLSGSNAPIAIDLKREVYRLVKLGKTEKVVKIYLVDRYGNFIVYDPPFRADTFVLWLGPLLFFLLTLSIILLILRKRISNSKEINQ